MKITVVVAVLNCGVDEGTVGGGAIVGKRVGKGGNRVTPAPPPRNSFINENFPLKIFENLFGCTQYTSDKFIVLVE